MQTNQVLLSQADLVARWGGRISVRTLANWRSQSNGPRYVKLGGRIAYRLADVAAWEERRTVGGTAQYRT